MGLASALKNKFGSNGNKPHEDVPVEEGPEAVMESEPMGDSEPPMVFCNTMCPERMSCARRLGFLDLQNGYARIDDAYGDQPDVDELLGELAGPLEQLRVTREECAVEQFEVHEERERVTQARAKELAPILERIGVKTGDGVSREEFDEVRSKLDIMLGLMQKSAGTVAPAAPAAAVPQAASVAVLDRDPVRDEEAAKVIAKYREMYPDDDAEAFRHMLAETGVTQGQYVRLTGRSKATVSSWKAPGARATSGLNRERASGAQA